MDDSSIIGRRGALTVLGGAVAAAGIATIPPATARGPHPHRLPIDFATPGGRSKAYMMMRGALDDRLVIGCASGKYYGVVADELTPLFGVVSATFARYRAVPTGGYEAVNVEYAYFTDPDTGRAMGPFRNPYTGETVEVPGGGYRPVTFTILPDLELRLGQPIPGLTFDHRVGPAEVRGDDVWITEVTRTTSMAPGQPRPFHYSESVILHARRQDLEMPGARRATCETSFTNVVGWRPWLKMGDRPGHMMSIGSGRYGATMETLPPAWIEATRAQHPALLADPVAILALLWKAR